MKYEEELVVSEEGRCSKVQLGTRCSKKREGIARSRVDGCTSKVSTAKQIALTLNDRDDSAIVFGT